MKRANLFELFVLVVFPELSVAMPSIFSGCVPSSSSAVEVQEWYPYAYELVFFVRGQFTEATRVYLNSRLDFIVYDDETKFDYVLLASNGVQVCANTGRNTDIEFLFGNKMKIRAKNGDNVSYSINFTNSSEANAFANYIISTDSARYKKCRGGHSYKLDTLYTRSTTGSLIDVGENWCIFKIRKANVTTFMIRWIAQIEEHRNAICVFRSTDYRLTPLPEANNKLELSLSFGGEILNPKYVVKTSTPDKIQTFFTRT